MFKHLLVIFTVTLLANFNTAYADVRGESNIDSLFSKILSEQRELIVHLPNNYHKYPELDYPVLYLLDGQRNFSHAVGSLDLLNQSYMAPEMIIVAIKNTHRTRDFTPTYDESYNRWGISGGADNFLDFMEKELIPYINKQYRANNFKALSGHSLSGLLAVYALHSRPTLFQAHFAFSPSLWWHKQVLFDDIESFFNKTDKLNNFLYINMANETGHMLSSFERYKQLLEESNIEGFSYHADLDVDENHSTSAMIGQTLAYRYLAESLQCPEEVVAQGLPAIEQFFKTQSEKYGYQIKPSYNTIRHAGYVALKKKDFAKAISTFELNVKNYPYIADGYSRLAYGLEANGELEQALAMVNIALTKSIEENVENNSYKHHRDNLTLLINEKSEQGIQIGSK